jgi:hypothetical protein
MNATSAEARAQVRPPRTPAPSPGGLASGGLTIAAGARAVKPEGLPIGNRGARHAHLGANQRRSAHSPRDMQRFARDPGRIGRREEHRGRRNVLRLADSPERRLGLDLLAEVALVMAGAPQALRLGHARIDRIDPSIRPIATTCSLPAMNSSATK